MSELREHLLTEPHLTATPSRLAPWQILILAPFAGTVMGVAARWWMRLITDDPEFSWSGTIFIVLAFTIAGTGHGLAWAARRAHLRRRWSTPARIVAAVLTLPMFAGAGMIMMPTVLGASLARDRTDWPRALRVVAVAVALPAIIIIAADLARGGVTPGRLLGSLLLVTTYTAVVRSISAVVAPIDDGWKMRRTVRVLVVIVVGLLVLFALTSVVGVATAAP
ncbi:MAG: hypothetical protein WEB78_10120 [Ilumatobacteraceae bacterium]